MPRGPRGATRGPTLECPACGQTIKARHPDQFRQHVGKCCPDVVEHVPRDAWADVGSAAAAVAAREASLLRTAKGLAYAPGDRKPVEEVASRMNLPPRRVKAILRKASKAIPLVADAAPLDVVHEDDDVLVVNKPPGLRFHPTHRFEGNSLLSRCLGHVRRNGDARGERETEDTDETGETGAGAVSDADAPRVVHRLDMDTSGVCLFVKDASLADGFARQFRGEEEAAPFGRASKEYLALCVGRVPRQDLGGDGAGGGAVVRFVGEPVEGARPVGDGDLSDDAEDAPLFFARDSASNTSKPSKTFLVDAHIGAHASIAEARWVHPPPPPDPHVKVGGHPLMDASAPKSAQTECAVVRETAFKVKDAKDAKTGNGLVAALVRARPLTGRTHQIRVHLAHASMPILSDPLYGPHVRWGGAAPAERRGVGFGSGTETEKKSAWGGALWLGRQALHAQRLTVTHPRTLEKLVFDAPMPEDMRRACEALGLDLDATEA